MERKTMGGLIAALRKANGMTQKDLAEKLHVSDKTVSRWERDEGTPDLSLIPVIAEIFGVTCDELLRGERRPEAERTDPSAGSTPDPKAEKQRKRLLAVCLSKYRTRSFICAGLSAAGLLAAMVCNFGFNRAYMGFFLGAGFYLAAVICQAIFINHALLSVADGDLSEAETGRFKRSVVRPAQWSFGFTAILLAFSLPLALNSFDAYMGLTAGAWFLGGLLLGAIALLLCGVVCYFLNGALLKKGVYALDEREKQAYWHNHRLKGRCAAGLILALAVTAAGNAAAIRGGNSLAFAEGTSFDDYESFIEYMEQDIPYYPYAHSGPDSALQTAPSSITYFDEAGNVISEEEALHRTITAPDGRVLCEYTDRNETVGTILYSYHADTGDALPITVFTHDAWKVGQAVIDRINTVFAGVYCVEAAAVFFLYFWKKAK